MYNTLLKQNIQDELNFEDFIFNKMDNNLLQEMLKEINDLGYKFRYLAEIEAYRIPGSGRIISKYISSFISEATRAYLLDNIVLDNTPDWDKLVLSLYIHFRESDSYISEKRAPAPAHIYVRYDNAFRKLKSKRIKEDLIDIVANPRDAHYLPFTTILLAKWKCGKMKDILLRYFESEKLTNTDIGLPETDDIYYPPLSFVQRELKFTAIKGLKYFPSKEVCELLYSCSKDPDKDIRKAAEKSLKVFKNDKEFRFDT